MFPDCGWEEWLADTGDETVNTRCFKKSYFYVTLKACINLFGGYAQYFELS
jgi:hypothetical protein